MSKVVQFPLRESGDAFTVKKLKWIEAVTLDASVSAEAARLATLLATRFLSRRSGCAFPSQKTLAEMLGITDRQVRRHLGALVDAGHIVQRNRGHNRVNEYRIAFLSGHPASSGTKRDRTSEGTLTGRGTSGPGADAGRPPNPMREPYEEPNEGRPPAAEPSDWRSTLNVSRDAPDGAPSTIASHESMIFRVGAWRTNSKGERYAITGIDPETRTVAVRFEDGRTLTTRAPVGAVLEPEGEPGEMDDEIPY